MFKKHSGCSFFLGNIAKFFFSFVLVHFLDFSKYGWIWKTPPFFFPNPVNISICFCEPLFLISSSLCTSISSLLIILLQGNLLGSQWSWEALDLFFCFLFSVIANISFRCTSLQFPGFYEIKQWLQTDYREHL